VGFEESQDALVRDCLNILGVALLAEWDALVFLCNHSASLCTVAQIAKLVGYDKVEIGPALHRLEALGLIQRSRVSQGIRFYRFSAPADSRGSCLLELMTLTHNRAGRLMLLKYLKRSGLPERRRRRRGGLRLA